MVFRLLKQRGRTRRFLSLLALLVVSFDLFCVSGAYAQESSANTAKPPFNVIFIIVDQWTYRLLAGPEYSLPAIDAIASHGVRFRNHYIASAMCSPSRATFLTGRPPQFHHVFDQMQYSYVPTLDPNIPNVAWALKALGTKTASFRMFAMVQEWTNP